MLIYVPFGVTLIVFGVLYFLSKGKYEGIIEPLNKKEYPFKDFLPIGTYLEDKIKRKYVNFYYQRIRRKIAALYGDKQLDLQLKVYFANKIVYFLLSLLVTTFLLAASGNSDATIIGFVFGLPILVFIAMDKDLNKKIEKRHKLIRYEFPDFLNKLILLINAGLTVPAAWEKIVLDIKENTPLYDEIRTVYREVKANKPQDQAYQDFSRRCKVPEITKFISVLLQNMKRGNSELVLMLRLQSNECWEMRKSVAKQLGEEASTKLLFPMMIMLLAIFIIVLVPAVLQLNSF